jgi:hypothetical protein
VEGSRRASHVLPHVAADSNVAYMRQYNKSLDHGKASMQILANKSRITPDSLG